VALDTLGPSHVWRTELHALGKITNGTLEGDLLIHGGGDPWLTEERFWTLLGQLRARGVHRITGDLLIDGSRFASPSRSAGDFDGQPWRLYNVMPHALLVNFKAITLEFVPAADRVDIRTIPVLPGFAIENRLRVTRDACRGIEASVQIEVPEPVRADHLVVEGSYPLACGRQALLRSYLTPETYAHALFKRLWTQWGGEFAGEVRSAVRPPGHPPLLVGESATLAEIIRPLNKWSNNPMADAVFLTIGADAGARGLSAARAEAAVHAYFRTHSLPADGLVLENGSGLSRHSRVSAASMSALLRHAWHSRYMPEFLASLSIVGVDGTLRKRLTQPPERGWMHLKSGYIDKVSAVSGYVRARSGRVYAVSFFLNGPSPAGRALGDALLRWTWQH
jgi:D-alanyl-D-alanine carboxypeptidase/D-alanyl-D-alanine-endopeptidase (penicillin-binding protein 4)